MLINKLIDFILDNFTILANNNNGLSVVKKAILQSKNLSIRKKISDKIVQSLDTLIQNPHGNYSIQAALDVADGYFSRNIIPHFYGKFYNLSLQKFSSNVIEKSLEKGEESAVTHFIEEICQKSKLLGMVT